MNVERQAPLAVIAIWKAAHTISNMSNLIRLTCHFQEGPLDLWRMRGDLALVQALISSRYVNYFQSEVVGVAEAERYTLVATVCTPANG